MRDFDLKEILNRFNITFSDDFLTETSCYKFRFKELIVSGINEESFTNTVYKIPLNTVAIYQDENFSGKTTFIEFCALSIHGDLRSSMLPPDLKDKIEKTEMSLLNGDNKLKIVRNFRKGTEEFIYNSKRLKYEEIFNIKPRELTVLLKTCHMLSQNDTADSYRIMKNTTVISDPKIEFLLGFIFDTKSRNVLLMLIKKRDEIQKKFKKLNNLQLDLESEIYKNLDFSPETILSYKEDLAESTSIISDMKSEILVFKDQILEIEEKIRNNEFSIEGIIDSISSLEKQMELYNSEEEVIPYLKSLGYNSCPICNKNLDINVIKQNICPLCKNDFEEEIKINHLILDFEAEKTILSEEIVTRKNDLEYLQTNLAELKQDKTRINTEISKFESKLVFLENNLKNKLNKLKTEYVSQNIEKINELESEKEKNLRLINDERDLIVDIENQIRIMTREIKEEKYEYLQEYITIYKNILSQIEPKIIAISFDEMIPVLGGKNVNSLQVGSLKLILSLTHLLTIQELSKNEKVALSFPLLLDEPLRHLDDIKKIKIIDIIQNIASGQILFTQPKEKNEILEGKFPKVIVETKSTKNKLDYFLNNVKIR